MSFLFPKPADPPEAPRPLNVQGDHLATNQEGTPLPYFVGVGRFAMKWIAPPYNQRTTEVKRDIGKSDVTEGHNYYADVAGELALGAIDALRAVLIDGEERWSGNALRDGGNPHNYSYQVADFGEFRIHWGTEAQPKDDLVLNDQSTTVTYTYDDNPWEFPWEDDPAEDIDFDVVVPGIPDNHPAYRGRCYVVIKQFFAGQNRTNVPNPEFIIERKPNLSQLPNEALTAEGVNPVNAIADLLAHKRGGLGLDIATVLDLAGSWTTLSNAFAANPARYYISPFVSAQKEAIAVVGDILSYFDGWLRIENGKLVIGYFPHDGVVPTVTTLSEHDFTRRPRLRMPGLEETFNRVNLEFRDRGRNLKEDMVPGHNQWNRKARGFRRVKRVKRPFIVQRQTARINVDEMAQVEAKPQHSGSGSVRAEKAVNTDSSRMRPGDRFQLSYAPYNLSAIERLKSRRQNFESGQVELEWMQERGLFPLAYTSPSDARPTITVPAPATIVNARLVELTPELAGHTVTTLAVLAERPQSILRGFNLWVSEDDASYDPIGSVGEWAVRGLLKTALGSTPPAPADAAVTFTVLATGNDIGKLQPHSDEQRLNDELLLWIGNEIFSVGDVTALGGDQYSIDASRARLGSSIATHSIDDEAWLLYRSDLVRFTHTRFLSAATRYFKLPTFTTNKVEDLSTAKKITQAMSTADAAPAIALDAENPSSVVVGIQFRLQGSVTFTHVSGDPEPGFVVWSSGPTKVSHWGGGTFSQLVAGQGRRFDIPVILAEAGAHTFYVAAFDHRRLHPLLGVTTVNTAITASIEDKTAPPAPQNVQGFRMPAEQGYLLQFDWPLADDVDYCWIYWTDQAGDTFADIVDDPTKRLWGTRDEDGTRLVDGKLVVDSFVPWSLSRINELITNYFFVVAVDFSKNLGTASAKIIITTGAARPAVAAEARIQPVAAPLSVIDINADNTKTPASVSMVVETVKFVPTPDYQWQEKAEGGSWANIAGQTTATLSRTAAQVEALGARGLFRCYIEDSSDATINGNTNECQIDINRHDHIGDPTAAGDYVRLSGSDVEQEVGSGNTKWMVKDGKASFGSRIRLMHSASVGKVFAGVDPDQANPLLDDYAFLYADGSDAGIEVGDGTGRISVIASVAGGAIVRHRGFDWYLETAAAVQRAFFDESTSILKYTDLDLQAFNGATKVWEVDESAEETWALAQLMDEMELGTGSAAQRQKAFYVGRQSVNYSASTGQTVTVSITNKGFSAAPEVGLAIPGKFGTDNVYAQMAPGYYAKGGSSGTVADFWTRPLDGTAKTGDFYLYFILLRT